VRGCNSVTLQCGNPNTYLPNYMTSTSVNNHDQRKYKSTTDHIPTHPTSHLSLSVTYPLPHHITPPRLALSRLTSPRPKSTHTHTHAHTAQLSTPVSSCPSTVCITSRHVGTPDLGIHVKHWLTCYKLLGLRTVSRHLDSTRLDSVPGARGLCVRRPMGGAGGSGEVPEAEGRRGVGDW
jgi:hypothetical protein